MIERNKVELRLPAKEERVGNYDILENPQTTRLEIC
jgi:hypothetical protein